VRAGSRPPKNALAAAIATSLPITYDASMTPSGSNTDPPKTSPEPSSRTALIATRLRQTARSTPSPVEAPLPSFALEHAVAGDMGHLHQTYNLSALPIESQRGLGGQLIVRTKRMLRRMLYPIVETQTGWNGANARVMTFTLRQLAAQARSIESLEQRVEELYEELHK
jgi:hypothetical protein